MRVLLAENDDSYTWNVLDALPFAREEVAVLPGRAVGAAPDLAAGYDAVVLGPGPTDPERAGLLGVVRGAAARRQPLFGVCLGFQAIGLAFGARVVRARPAHGVESEVEFRPSRCLPGIVGRQSVMRYHSLALADVAEPLSVFAATDDGLPMALEHATLPIAGVQFHPDSYATPQGRRMFAAFFAGLR